MSLLESAKGLFVRSPNTEESSALGAETKVPLYQFQRKGVKETEEMIDVMMNTYGVSSANHEYPILKTTGIGPCVAVALWEPQGKVAGLIHIIATNDNPSREVRQDILNVFNAMKRNGAVDGHREKIQVHIVGGLEDDHLHDTILDSLKGLEIENILTNERAEVGASGHCIAIDARTGELFNLTDIQPKEIDNISAILALNGTIRTLPTRDSRTLN